MIRFDWIRTKISRQRKLKGKEEFEDGWLDEEGVMTLLALEDGKVGSKGTK